MIEWYSCVVLLKTMDENVSFPVMMSIRLLCPVREAIPREGVGVP